MYIQIGTFIKVIYLSFDFLLSICRDAHVVLGVKFCLFGLPAVYVST